MTRTVQSSQLNGNTVRDVMDGQPTIVTYHGRQEVLMIQLPRDWDQVDGMLLVTRAIFEEAVKART